MKVLSNTHKGGVVQCLLIEKSHHIGDQHDWKNPRQKSLVQVQKKCLFFQLTHIKSIFRTSFFSALAENWNEDSRAQFSTLWPSSFSPYSGSFLIESFDILKRTEGRRICQSKLNWINVLCGSNLSIYVKDMVRMWYTLLWYKDKAFPAKL